MRHILRFLILIYCLTTATASYGWSFFFNEEKSPPPIVPPVNITVMIDPAGDTRNPGREIDDTFERSITLHCAEELKKQLETTTSGLRILLTRFPGETVEPLQNISFANRLAVNLYLSINFFEQNNSTIQLYFYHFLYDPVTDFVEKKESALTLLPYNQAYKRTLTTTKQYSSLLYESCKKSGKALNAYCRQPIGLPFKPLIGICAPALGIEIGITHKDQWKELVPLLTQAITSIITTPQP